MPVRVFNLHRSHEEAGDASMEQLLDESARVTGPVVLLGDFNLTPMDWRMELFRKRWIDPMDVIQSENTQLAGIVGTFQPMYWRIDYVLVEPEFFHVQDAGVTPKEYWEASDHFGFWVRLRRKPNG